MASERSQAPSWDETHGLRSRTANNITTSDNSGSNTNTLPKIPEATKKYQSKGSESEASITWKLRPLRLLREDAINLKSRYWSDWTTINQQVIASSVYMFFTNILPGITFANDLNELTGASWGTIEVVFSTGLCGVIFSLLVFWSTLEPSSFLIFHRFSAQPLTILGVTGPFSVLAENIYTLSKEHFHVRIGFNVLLTYRIC